MLDAVYVAVALTFLLVGAVLVVLFVRAVRKGNRAWAETEESVARIDGLLRAVESETRTLIAAQGNLFDGLARLRESHDQQTVLELARSTQASDVGEAVRRLQEQHSQLADLLTLHASEPHLLSAAAAPNVHVVVTSTESTLQAAAGVLPSDYSIGEAQILEYNQNCGGHHEWQPRTVRSTDARLEAVDVCTKCGPDGAVRIRRLR